MPLPAPQPPAANPPSSCGLSSRGHLPGQHASHTAPAASSLVTEKLASSCIATSSSCSSAGLGPLPPAPLGGGGGGGGAAAWAAPQLGPMLSVQRLASSAARQARSLSVLAWLRMMRAAGAPLAQALRSSRSSRSKVVPSPPDRLRAGALVMGATNLLRRFK